MTSHRAAFLEILNETKDYFQQFSPLDCFAVSDRTLFPKNETKTLRKEPSLPVPPISARRQPQVAQAPVKEEKKPVKEAPKEIQKDEFCVLTPLKQEVIQPLTLVGDTILRIAPHFKILWDIPNDAEAVAIKNRWQVRPPASVIVLLTNEKNKDTLFFLHNLSKAITKQFALTQVITMDKMTRFEFLEGVKVIIAVEKEIHQSKLLPFYRKIPTTAENFLKEIPLILMNSPSHYLANPSEKRPLWNDLCQKIARHL